MNNPFTQLTQINAKLDYLIRVNQYLVANITPNVDSADVARLVSELKASTDALATLLTRK